MYTLLSILITVTHCQGQRKAGMVIYQVPHIGLFVQEGAKKWREREMNRFKRSNSKFSTSETLMRKACFVKMFLYQLEKIFFGSGVGSLMVCCILTYLCYSGLCRGWWWITLALTRCCCALQLQEDTPKNTSPFHGLRDIIAFFFNGFGVRV